MILRSKATFDAAVARYSECATAKSGGDMGVVEKGTLANIQDFEDVALRLAPNEVSDVVVTHLGLHILFRIADDS